MFINNVYKKIKRVYIQLTRRLFQSALYFLTQWHVIK
jgi:hypothetical protein